jgi:hypothetical protein
MLKRTLLAAAFGALLTVPAPAISQEATWEVVRQTIRDRYEYNRDNLSADPNAYSSEGAIEFWSSGGLVQWVPGDAPADQYDAFNVYPKHIWVTMLADDQVAVANFYAEGSFQPKGGSAVTDYLTRVTQILVMEDGRWKVRSSHFSPLMGGSGTYQRTLD